MGDELVETCEECGSQNSWHHESDCPNYEPVIYPPESVAIAMELERDRLRVANTASALRRKVLVTGNGAYVPRPGWPS